MLPRDKMSRLQEIDRGTGAHERLTALFDEGSFVETEAMLDAGVVTGYGTVEGCPCFAYAQKDGVFSSASAERVRRLYALAQKNGAPVAAIFDSPGAKLTEGVELLSAYGVLLHAANSLSGVIPQIAVVTGACLGTSALLAAASDFVIAVKDAELYLSASDKTESAAEAGIAHRTAEDAGAAIADARRLIALLPSNNLDAAPMYDFAAPAAADALRDEEPDVEAAIRAAADEDSLLALSEGYAPEALTFLGTVAGQPAAFAGVSGELTAQGCRKLVRFAKFADAFSLPLLTFLDTPGFAEDGVSAITYYAKLANVYAEATCPQLAVVIGRAYGPVFTALAGKGANADAVYAWPNAVISPLRPETAVSILYNDRISAEHTRAQLVSEYEDGEASAFAAAAQGALDDVIDPAQTRAAVVSALGMISGKRESRLAKKHTTL